MSTWMKDALIALVLAIVALGIVLVGHYDGPIIIILPIAMFVISFLSDTWRHRKRSEQPLEK